MTPEAPIDGQPELPAIPAPYDVCTPDRLPSDRLAFVERIHRHFLQAFAAKLSSHLDTVIEAASAGLDQTRLGDFLETGATDACVVTFGLSPTGGKALAGMSSGFLFRVLDTLLGAPQTAAAAPAPRAGVTEIEQHVLREFFHALETTLDAAWSQCGIRMAMAGVSSGESIRETPDPDATALVLHCRVKFAEAEEAFRVAVPMTAIRLAALQLEANASRKEDGELSARLARLEVLGGAAIQLEAVLAGSSIRLGDLAAMQPGQILVLTQPAGSQLQCLVNGKAKYRGEWIAQGDRHALQVETLV